MRCWLEQLKGLIIICYFERQLSPKSEAVAKQKVCLACPIPPPKSVSVPYSTPYIHLPSTSHWRKPYSRSSNKCGENKHVPNAGQGRHLPLVHTDLQVVYNAKQVLHILGDHLHSAFLSGKACA